MTTRADWARRLLQTALPSPLQTVVLDVCINADDQAFDAWRRSIGTGAEARLFLGRGDERLRRVVSLLYRRIRDSGIAVDRTLLTYLRTATVREQMRAESVEEHCASALTCLNGSGVIPIVVNGVAMANTVYAAMSERHCHDLDLLVGASEARVAEDALASAGFLRSLPRAHASANTVWLSHSSEFVVALHRIPYRVRAWNDDAAVTMQGAVKAAIAGQNVRMFADEDALVRVLCNGLSAGSRHSPGWALDAALLIAVRKLDWDKVVAIARACGRRDTVVTGLEFLQQALRVDIPGRVLDELRSGESDESAIASTVEAARLSAYGSRLGLVRRSRRAGIVRTALWAVQGREQTT